MATGPEADQRFQEVIKTWPAGGMKSMIAYGCSALSKTRSQRAYGSRRRVKRRLGPRPISVTVMVPVDAAWQCVIWHQRLVGHHLPRRRPPCLIKDDDIEALPAELDEHDCQRLYCG